jgi:hypothetical protein
MKVRTEIVEVEGEGLVSLLGKDVELFCGVYIYAGKLLGVNDTCVKLGNPYIVYETGAFSDKKYKDAQSMCKAEHYVTLALLESFGETTRL